MNDFLNPYQFIPVTGKISRTRSTEVAKAESTPHARHDLWQSDTQSGRIICRLHLDTPTVVGGEQVDEPGTLSKRVMPYLRNGKPAVPGSSLRGMVTSLAEALSQSSLRVLENRDLVVSCRDKNSTRRLKAGKVYDYFRAIDPDLVPWKTSDRQFLTPADLLFGVVDEREAQDDDDSHPAFHLASRLRFADALPHPDRPPILGAKVTLKILASPKGRYPGMYFHPTGQRGDFIPKCHAFYKENGRHEPRYVPNGRKVYVHHGRDDLAAEAWVTRDPKKDPDQKLRCTPIYNHRYRDGDSDLWFHIDFENLSNAELTLLLTSLKPADEFRHRLGLGKPLGLGTVQIDIEGVFFVDRITRYAKDPLDEPRYHKVWRPAPAEPQSAWAWRYPEEVERLAAPASFGEADWWINSLIDPATLVDVLTLGDPKFVKARVHTPTMDRRDTEDKTFAWFAENEKAGRPQALPKVIGNQELLTLHTYPAPAREAAGPGGGKKGGGKRR